MKKIRLLDKMKGMLKYIDNKKKKKKEITRNRVKMV